MNLLGTNQTLCEKKIMQRIEIDIMRMPSAFIDAVFKGDTSSLGKQSAFLIERELRWYKMEAEEGYPNFVELNFELVSDKPFMSDCHITGTIQKCVDVRVLVVLSTDCET